MIIIYIYIYMYNSIVIVSYSSGVVSSKVEVGIVMTMRREIVVSIGILIFMAK